MIRWVRILILYFHMNKDSRQSKSLPRAESRGFTLIEILVATTIFMVVSVIALAVITSVIGSSTKTQAILNVQESGRLAMEMMTGEIKKSQAYTINNSGQITIGAKIFALYRDSDIAVGGKDCAANNICYIGFKPSGLPVAKITSPDTTDVRSLEFTPAGGTFTGTQSVYVTIKTTIKTKSQNVKESQTQELQTSVVPFYQDGLNTGWSYN